MHVADRRSGSRMGDVRALLRVSRGLQYGSVDTPGDSGATAVLDSATRKRRLVAMFCKMLGEQLGGGEVERLPRPRTEPLSPRERQTLELLLTGCAEKQIALRLSISRNMVHVYVKALYKRFGVCSRGELLARWVQR